MERTINTLRSRFPTLRYREHHTFCWSPKTNEILYVKSSDKPSAIWSLLHETSHALLQHTAYKADFELLQLEVAAWEKAKELAPQLGVTIDEDHIQNCLDTYRDWLYARSICPTCDNKSLQTSELNTYQCFNCHMTWKVSPSRFCRAYRSTKPKSTSMLSGSTKE